MVRAAIDTYLEEHRPEPCPQANSKRSEASD
jgi:hypothetical protein